jgi:cyanophycinase
VVDVSSRDDGFNEKSLGLIREADALFFTGGDQLNVTSLMGGSPLDILIDERLSDGLIIAGTSAGAAMMSSTMITSGGSGNPPMVGGVDFAPGMNLVLGTVIDTHFSQRARHGRLLTAVAHYPEAIGLGIDEKTAMVIRRHQFKVIGDGVVTVVDGSQMRHCDLPYREKGQSIGMFGADIHVLPAGYHYDLHKREPIAPALKKFAGTPNEE